MSAGPGFEADARPVLLRASDRVEVPWRNGGGTTTVVASSNAREGAGGAELDWRVSIATISEAGPFSVFPGVDRVLVPLSPAGLTLEVGGRVRHVARHEAIAFTGEEAVAAIDVDSPGDDLNLMTRRGVVEGSLEVRRLVDGAEFATARGETIVLVVLSGEVGWGDERLGPRDAMLLPPSVQVVLIGAAEISELRCTHVPVKARQAGGPAN